MKSRRFNPIVFLVLVSVFIFIVSCTNRLVGYAVVLWPDDALPLRAGQVVPIQSVSDIQGTAMVQLDDTATITVDRFRILEFETTQAAEAYRNDFLPFTDLYATSLRTALPVREKADRLSSRVYRLRDGEIMKVLRRQDEPSDEAGFVDYWYEVLTREGISGWVFGYYLDLSDSGGRSLQPEDDANRVDRMISDIRSRIWRPDYFKEMIENRRVDLSTFSHQYGFFPLGGENAFRLVLPEHEVTFEYLDYFSPRSDTIEFENSSLILRLVNDTTLTVQYNLNGQESAVQFVELDIDIDDVIQAEQQRRGDLLAEFLSRGNVLASSAYGSIRLGTDGTMTWEGFERLVPQVVPRDFTGTGRLEFSVFMDDDLRSIYDGVFRIDFLNGDAAVFFYSLTDDGLRTVYVPGSFIEENTVSGEALTPVVVFFRFVKS